MYQVVCNQVINNGCDVIFSSTDLESLVAQIQMHCKGSHGVDVSGNMIRNIISPEMGEIVTVEVTKVPVNEIPVIEVKPDEKTKEKGKRLSFLRKLKK